MPVTKPKAVEKGVGKHEIITVVNLRLKVTGKRQLTLSVPQLLLIHPPTTTSPAT
jgi:hypothetical protein